MMSDQTTPNDLSWLDWGNEKQMKWALQHFSKRGFFHLATWSQESAIPQLKIWLEGMPSSADTELLMDKAKNAWRQQKHRKQNPGHKGYNFVLPTGVQATLKQLASKRGTNMTEALKELIGEALEEEKHHQKELKGLQNQHKQTLENLKRGQSEVQKRLTEHKKNAERQIKAYAKTLADLNRATKELAEEIRRLLLHKVENELGISRETASPDDLSTLNELHTEELAILKRRFTLEHAIEAFSDRPPRKANARTPRTEAPPKADKR
jgi:predicted Zn-dependent protease with MMP-like domain